MRSSGKLKKRGMESEYMYMAMLAIIIIVLIAIFIFNFFQTAKDKLEIQDCRNSIGAHAVLATVSQREIFTDIKCQTRELLIDASNENKAKKKIAEDMRRCWYEWQKGDAQLFEGEGIFCHICSVYSFKQNTTITQFQSFLMNENIDLSSKYPEETKKVTYMTYFQGYRTPLINEIENLPNVSKTPFKDTSIIDTSKKYSTIFVYASGKEDMQAFLEGGTRSTVLVGGGVLAGGGVIAILAGVGPPGWIIGGIVVGGVLIWQALTFEQPQWLSVIQFIEYDNKTISDLGCQYLEANQLSSQK
jgi:hypothetical protein